MTDIYKLAPFILKWEGGYVNHPNDPGGATNKGVTIAVWKAQGYDKDKDGDIDVQDLKLISTTDAINIMKKNYWDRWKADQIDSQVVANILVDWVWGSGKYGITIPQRILGITQDGVVGPKTIKALNDTIKKDKAGLIDKLYKARAKYLQDIVTNNYKLRVFLKGWTNRLNDLITYNKNFK